VAQKIESLEHFGLNLIGAHVALWHDDKRAFKHAFVVKVHLALPGPDIHAEDHGHDLYQAIDVVTDRLAEQLRHRKSKLVKGTRDKSRKAKLRRQVALAGLTRRGPGFPQITALRRSALKLSLDKKGGCG
jgi:putative sigma-54 modulation protein